MEILSFGLKILLIATGIFWIIFFSLCIFWSRMGHKELKYNIPIALSVSFLYTLPILVIGVFVIAITAWLGEYWPKISYFIKEFIK